MKKHYTRIKERWNSSPIQKHLGMEVIGLSGGLSRVKMVFKKELGNIYNTLHGGIISALIDNAIGLAALTLINEEKQWEATLELKVNYLNPVKNEGGRNYC